MGVQQVQAHGGDPSFMHACVNTRSGAVKMIAPDGTCHNRWTATDWSITGPAGLAFPITCPPDSVLSGTTCIDTYEASVWQTANATLIGKIKDGTVTLIDLTGAGATQLCLAGGDLVAAGCPDTGNGCVNIYAVSIPGVTPSAFLTWFQAAAAALGTPDTGGADNGTTTCNTDDLVSGPLTGARSACVSNIGAFDMVGNVEEWVADWVPQSTTCVTPLFGTGNANCLAGASTTTGPGALRRGGRWFSGAGAGVFDVFGGNNPSSADLDIGFRCAR